MAMRGVCGTLVDGAHCRTGIKSHTLTHLLHEAVAVSLALLRAAMLGRVDRYTGEVSLCSSTQRMAVTVAPKKKG